MKERKGMKEGRERERKKKRESWIERQINREGQKDRDEIVNRKKPQLFKLGILDKGKNINAQIHYKE